MPETPALGYFSITVSMDHGLVVAVWTQSLERSEGGGEAGDDDMEKFGEVTANPTHLELRPVGRIGLW